MTNTNQAFIEAYERTASQQAMQGSLQNRSPADRGQTVTGPHFHVEESTKTRGPLSSFLSQRLVDSTTIEGLSSEANLQANINSNHSVNTIDLDLVSVQSTFEVTRFRWPAPAIELAKSTNQSMIAIIDQVIASSTKVLALGSARQQVGLTTTTLAFAHTALELGMKVAIIDLCSPIRSQSHEKRYGLTNSLGFTKVRTLSETATLGMALGEAIVSSTREKASLILAGDNLESNVAKAAITRIAESHDFVLIDAGIVGAPERSLSEWIEPVRGAALLVDLAEGSRHDAARCAAADQLTSISSSFLGVIENLV